MKKTVFAIIIVFLSLLLLACASSVATPQSEAAQNIEPTKSVKKAEPVKSNESYGDKTLAELLEIIKADADSLISDTQQKADKIIATVTDYNAYLATKQQILDFYEYMYTSLNDLYDSTEQIMITFYKKIPVERNMDKYSDWDNAFDDSYRVWDRLFDDTYRCWDRIHDDFYYQFDRIISAESDRKGAYDEWNEMHDARSDSWSALYDARSNAWSQLYDERSEVWSAFYDEDTNVDAAIQRAKEQKSATASPEARVQNPVTFSPSAELRTVSEPTESPATNATEPPVEEVEKSGIRPEFQKAMDEYLSFFKEYCSFMEEYQANPSPTLLTRYADLLSKYQVSMEALQGMDSSTWTKEEQMLYLDTMNTIQKMLVDVQ